MYAIHHIPNYLAKTNYKLRMLGVESSTAKQESNARSDQIADRNERVFCNMIWDLKIYVYKFPKELQ